MTDSRAQLSPELRQAISASPLTFEMLAEQSVVPILFVQQDRARYVNPACETLTGYSRAELLKLNFWELTPPEHQPRVMEWGREVQAGKIRSARIETCITARDGSLRWIDVTGWPIVFDQQPAMAAMAVDITTRVRVEQALRASEVRYRTVVEAQSDLVFRWSPGGQLTDVNDAFCRCLATPREQLASLGALTPANPMQMVERRVLTPSGEIIWLHWSDLAIYDEEGKIREFQSIGRDITTRMLVEESLRQSEERFRSLVRNMPGAVYRCRCDAARSVEFISEAIESIAGHRAEEFTQEPYRSCGDLVHPDDKALYEEAIRRALAEREPFGLEFRILHRDGSIRRVSARGRPIFNHQGEPLWIDGVLFDITHVRELERRLREAERLAIIAQTITGVTHHIKNITNTLRGSGFLINNAIAAGDMGGVSGLWEVFVRNIERLAALIESMLNFTRPPRLELRDVCPRALLREIHENCLALASTRRTVLLLEAAAELPSIRCDREAIAEVLLNLVCNALDACEEVGGGKVSLGAEWDAAAPAVRFTVSDNGPGIAEHVRAEIYNPFFTTKGSKGNGLGLTIVQKLVHEHGGSIEFESRPGHTRFTILLPQ
jgi:PAS domain S-box-containing protein